MKGFELGLGWRYCTSAKGGELTVSTCPGSTPMTLMRVAMSSLRKLSVKLRTAALVAQ